jgi:transposase
LHHNLTEISTQVAADAHAVVLLDGAGWHQPGERLPVPDNISLLPLPSYSPELNPVENIWQFYCSLPSSSENLPRPIEQRGAVKGLARRLLSPREVTHDNVLCHA